MAVPVCILTTWVDDTVLMIAGIRRGGAGAPPGVERLTRQQLTLYCTFRSRHELGCRRSREGYLLFVMPIPLTHKQRAEENPTIITSYQIILTYGDAQRPLS